SAEALLVRRDGDSVLFLSERRFQPSPASPRRISLSRRDVPAVMAVLGTEGVVRAVDYRGVKVLAMLRAVPGTPWFLVVKVDEAEALAVWRTRIALVFAVLLGLVLAAGATAITLGQRSATAHYQRLYEAEAALGASEARFRTLVEEAGDGFALLDAEGRYLDVNSACCQHLGYAREDLLRLSIADIDSLFSPQRFAADFQSLVGKPPVTYESVHRRKDGTTFPVEVTLSIVRIGGVPQALSLVRDITERKRAEEALQRSSQLLRDTGEMAQVGGWELDLSTKEVSWTGEVYRIHGVEPGHKPKLEEALSFYAPESRPALEAALKKTAETGEPYALESLFIPRGSKDKIWVRSLGRAVYSGGRIARLAGTFQNIDKYKRAEEALRKSEEELRYLFKSMINAFAIFESVFDDDGHFIRYRFVYINDAYERITGVKNEEVRGKTVHEVWPGTEPEWIKRYGEVAVTGVPQTFDLLHGPTGKLYHCNVYRPWDTTDRLCVISEDITERKRTEEALKESEIKYRTLIDLTGTGYLILDLQGRVLDANQEYVRLSGHTKLHDILGKSVIAWTAEGAKQRNAEAVAQCGKNGFIRDFVTEYVDGGGKITPIEISASVDGEGESLRIVSLCRDITERKRAEEALRESEERHRSIIEQLNDVYYRTDRDGRITMMSPSAAHLFGFPSTSEMIGRPIESLWQDPSRRAALLASIGERGFVRDYETTAVRTDGTPFAVAVSSHYVRDASGAADGVEGIIRDITERKQTEVALRALARHVDSVREEEHIRIARQIHDELGQALTALRLDLTWVGRKIPKGNTALRRRIDAAVALTDATIAVGQRIAGELRPPILDDLGLVPALEWYAQHFAKRSGLRIELDVGAEEPVVPDHLAVTAYRIVQEALTNVARHAQATHARVRLGEQDGALTIEIRDDGQGFPEEAIRNPRSFGIVGMRERADSHGGALVITSSPGAGTTVRVTFPLERREEPRVPR
ncbi:MAG: PAS domain S-box protein, partial [Planctomycetota bacterium]